MSVSTESISSLAFSNFLAEARAVKLEAMREFLVYDTWVLVRNGESIVFKEEREDEEVEEEAGERGKNE